MDDLSRANMVPGRARPLLYALPPALIVVLVGTYAVAPGFYLRVILACQEREHQVVEIVTFASAVIAAATLGWASIRLWVMRPSTMPGGGSLIVGVIAAAAFFFAGEEISWGQDYFGWATPEAMQAHTPQTNLHNIDRLPIRVQTLASLFLIAMFFVLPGVWKLGRDHGLPRDWQPAIAEGPVVSCMAVAFLWRGSKKLYCWLNPEWEADPTAHPWYWNFFEQVGEQKEMLVAISLLMYGSYRLQIVRRRGPGADS